MKKIRAAVVGYGNIGKYTIEALQEASDFEIAGVVRRQADQAQPLELQPYKVTDDITTLGQVDVAILALPTRLCPDAARKYAEMGICTVDSYDIHTGILEYHKAQDKVCKNKETVSVIAAGWDPGSDSVVRALMQSLSPKGITYTNFGPGMSMGHSVCAKSKPGVKDALSMTIPLGEGIHRRMVYVELEEGADIKTVTSHIKEDPYFIHDETHVFAVASVDALKDMGHGVHMVRKGVSGQTHNQHISFDMSINNPALTAQVLVNVARATKRLRPGCYTMIEIPVVDMLPGEKEEYIANIV